ncbi:unnamed protein product [Miscanthus lutarioriparius]|uniref:FAE domain-containing protein n=1 Tax=Miscanthus lutarioriparius TaxID=422564 RepID=A0A811NHS9_9POAL|nr:unnamed protein product [Miscanthus lutarioriparius]
MDVEHKDHLLAFRRHAALYLVPACAMLLLWRFNRRTATAAADDVGLVDFSCLRPPRRLRIPIPGLLEHLRLVGCFDDGSVEFMSPVIEACGMGEETYFPPSLHYIPPSATNADAVAEARGMYLPTLDALFARTGLPPSAVGALVVNCSGFCPAPSLAALIAGHYRMRADVRTFSLSGMGCAAGVVGVDVARGVLSAHAAVRYALVVSAEIVTVGWYSGRDRCKLLLNCFFRTGLAEGLGLVEREAEVALMTFHRFGNQSAASLWYQLAYHEATGGSGAAIGRGSSAWGAGRRPTAWCGSASAKTQSPQPRTMAPGPTASTDSPPENENPSSIAHLPLFSLKLLQNV